jgi:GNAT superfamily N-acetyltransferase
MSDAPITTRLATDADLAGVRGLVEQFRAEFGYTGDGEIPELGEAFHVLVAERGGDVVGMLAIQRCHDLARGSRFLLLTDIFVAASERRHGVARELMRAVKELCPRMGCEGMSLVVSEVNVPALTTAARAGFTRHDQLLFTFDPTER